ncbi:alpha/beta hydrolase [Bacillus sp. SM2101]|uniref:alpha/beta fold hydrolase n=1 Tax=Bacillus sp. SM2101 TaxID=2805366 RepID=UPI001BDE8E41|nr:alpha/beta hydrolase [Bacillus sp. SM2101]
MKSRFRSLEGKQLLYESYDHLLNLWDVDLEEQDIDTRFGKTHVIITGNKKNPPLILFHGTGDNSAIMWIYNIKELAQQFYVIAIDTLGGAGKSEPNDEYYNNFQPHLWIDDIFETYNISKAHMAGVSYGIYLALSYEIRNPHRVDKIICMASFIPIKGLGLKYTLLGIKSVMVFFPEVLKPSEKNALKLLRKLGSPISDTHTMNNKLLKHFLFILKYSKPERRKFTSYEMEALSSFKQKALFLIGDSDSIVYHPSYIDFFKANHFNYKIIKDAGHSINQDQWDIVNKEMTGYLIG